MQTSNQNAVTILRVVANTASVHNVIVCTLCSCYPIGLLGFSPSWYKSRAYRSRVVREPRKVLAEFGLDLPATTSIRVHDSTADCRYFVLPLPPAHLTQESINAMSHEELKKLVTRDSMIGVAVL
jgi:nitrile hydratase